MLMHTDRHPRKLLSVPRPLAAACLLLGLALASMAGEAPLPGAKETFVDLPERGEDLPAIPGFSLGAGGKAPTPTPKRPNVGKIPVVQLPADDPIPDTVPEGWGWRRHKGGAYAFLLPKEDRKYDFKEGVQNIKDAKIPYILVHCEITDNVTFDMRILKIPVPPGQMLDRVTITEMVRDVYAQDSGGKIVSQGDIKRGKIPGKEYRIEQKDGEITRLRLLLVGTALYQLTVTGTKEQVDGEIAKRIFSSFKHQGMVQAEKKNPATK